MEEAGEEIEMAIVDVAWAVLVSAVVSLAAAELEAVIAFSVPAKMLDGLVAPEHAAGAAVGAADYVEQVEEGCDVESVGIVVELLVEDLG